MNFPACLYGVRTCWCEGFVFLSEEQEEGRMFITKAAPKSSFCCLCRCHSTYLVAFSRRFIIIKMNSAEIKHNTMRIDHNAHNSICPQSIPMIETR